MKMLLIGLLLLGLAAPVQGNELCESIGEAASAAMKGRQIGLSKSTIEGLMRDSGLTGQAREMVQAMIDTAYARPMQKSESVQDMEVRRHRLLWEAACYDSLAE